MDSTVVQAVNNNGVLNATIMFENLLYQCNHVPVNGVQIDGIVEMINAKEFKIEKGNIKQLNVSLISKFFSLQLIFTHCCSKHWVQVGTFNDLDKVLKSHPLTHYEYGTNYNGYSIKPLVINTWNRGIRISTVSLMPSGDNAKTMKPYRILWTKNTDDAESKEGEWYHQYVDQQYKPFYSNGKMNPTLFAKKL